jgi:5'-deoxynucleotidase YfbR-like HD superfamily hydrolase
MYQSLKEYPKGVIVTGSGKIISLKEPKSVDMDILDIANALSKIARFNGRCRHFYSVAQHSILVCKMVHEHCANNASCFGFYGVEGLMHDAAEAYVHDISTPIKEELGWAYGRLENRFAAVIKERFQLSDGPYVTDLIKDFDKQAAELEYKALFLGDHTPLVTRMAGLGMYVGHSIWTHGFAYKAFLETYKELDQIPFKSIRD